MQMVVFTASFMVPLLSTVAQLIPGVIAFRFLHFASLFLSDSWTGEWVLQPSSPPALVCPRVSLVPFKPPSCSLWQYRGGDRYSYSITFDVVCAN